MSAPTNELQLQPSQMANGPLIVIIGNADPQFILNLIQQLTPSLPPIQSPRNTHIPQNQGAPSSAAGVETIPLPPPIVSPQTTTVSSQPDISVSASSSRTQAFTTAQAINIFQEPKSDDSVIGEASTSSYEIPQRRTRMCARCRGHDELHPVKGHICMHRRCKCAHCSEIKLKNSYLKKLKKAY